MKIDNRSDNPNPDRLMSNFRSAYRSRAGDGPAGDDEWRQGVMRSIRKMAPPERPEPEWTLGRLAWRLAPAALALFLILSVLVFRMEDTLEYQVAGLMISDPIQPYLTEMPF